MQDTKECPYVRLARLAQDRARKAENINILTAGIKVLEEQLHKKEIELSQDTNAKAGIEAKMKAVSQELT